MAHAFLRQSSGEALSAFADSAQYESCCRNLLLVDSIHTSQASLTMQVSSSGGDTTVNVLTMAENTLGGALLFFHDMESDGVCSTDFHDCEVQVYVEKVENSVRGLSRSVKRGAYCISRNM